MIEYYKKLTIRTKAIECAMCILVALGFSFQFVINIDDMLTIGSFGEALLYGNGENLGYFLYFIVGCIFCLVGIFKITKALTEGYLWQMREDIAKTGYSISDLEPDFEASVPCGYIRIGQKMIYFWEKNIPRVYEGNRILWVYSGRIFSPQGQDMDKTCATIYTENRVQPILYKNLTSDIVNGMLEEIEKKYPWVVIGYSKEKANLFKNNREAFKELKYNKVMSKS